nr:transcription factor bHLH120-like [Solanum lycopersicum]
MDDSEFDFGQLDQLFNFLSSPSPPPPPPTTLQSYQDSSFSLQKQNSNIVFTSTHNVPKKKPILITNINIIDDQVIQDLPKEKEMVVEKKVMRRDVERQRRRDMAKLYQRLRLLIPSKYLMGKRSISDHLEEIVDYVKDLKKDIEELESKREKLKEMKNITNISSPLAPNSSSMKLNDDDDEDKIIVKSCNEGVEISIKGVLSISKVLKVLMKEGFIVNSCVSSTINQRLIHIIQTKVNKRGDIDLALLRSKLMGLF